MKAVTACAIATLVAVIVVTAFTRIFQVAFIVAMVGFALVVLGAAASDLEVGT